MVKVPYLTSGNAAPGMKHSQILNSNPTKTLGTDLTAVKCTRKGVKGATEMKKVKTILISLVVFWLVCYALMFLLNGVIFDSTSQAAGDLSTRQILEPSKEIVMVSLSSIAVQIPSKEQSKKEERFTRPMLSASLVTVLAGLAVACGYQLIRLGWRGNPPLMK